MKEELSFVHVTPSASRLGGGLFESVRRLSQSVQAASRTRVRVLALEDCFTGNDLHHWAPLHIKTYRVLGPRGFGYAPGLRRALTNHSASLVHLHGLWRYSSLVVWRWARCARRPYIVSPHGMLEPWALIQSMWKKRLALRLYVGPCLHHAACLRATSHAEAASIRGAGFKNPIAVIPNGICLPPSKLRAATNETFCPRRALFLSRIHPKKGLLNLIHAWAHLRPKNWELCIAGPDEANHLATVTRLVRNSGLEPNVRFLGELWGDAKTRGFFDSDLFVLPSFSENFGLAIGEALAHGLPVITTQATPWQELRDHCCGWWIALGVEPLVEALQAAFNTPVAVLREMGQRGRKLVGAKYTWELVGQSMLEVYEWMLSRGEKPDYVLTVR